MEIPLSRSRGSRHHIFPLVCRSQNQRLHFLCHQKVVMVFMAFLCSE
ncbi:hypothetical protein FGIG_11781 [Fasciola gigantica]|uniref:Uncharacterized protein n=1 Tax=Fasciola gigantica TaxID=46835 RepID=A0A504ZAE4_FASGI|nr:hypothetical protein FGIG_11781 [Fasciola gigantica]